MSDATGSEEEVKSGRQPVEESADFNPDHAEAFVAWFAVDCRSSAIHPGPHHNSPRFFGLSKTARQIPTRRRTWLQCPQVHENHRKAVDAR